MHKQYRANTKYYQIQDAEIEMSLDNKLTQKGPDALTTNELIQASLGNEKIQSAINEYGSGLLASIHSVEDAQSILKISHNDAIKLYAILTLGKRLFAGNQGSLVQIRCAEDVYTHCRSMENLPSEQLKILLINSRYQLVHEEILAIGGIESAQIAARDIFHPAVERRVSSIVLVHNHPSGDPTPSSADVKFTQETVKAGELLGVSLLDHIIIGNKSYISCISN